MAMNLRLSECFSCKSVAIWIGTQLIWPAFNLGLEPNPDMPAAIRADYDEAASIVNLSPRGAAALLRLTLEKLVTSLTNASSIGTGIQDLVDKGLPIVVQQACDYVRIVGNDAVHPGQIDLKDDIQTAQRLFQLINLIVTHTISFQNTMSEIYPTLPENQLGYVADRMRGAAKKAAQVEPRTPVPAPAPAVPAPPLAKP
jgi:hypothetical protein